MCINREMVLFIYIKFNIMINNQLKKIQYNDNNIINNLVLKNISKFTINKFLKKNKINSITLS